MSQITDRPHLDHVPLRPPHSPPLMWTRCFSFPFTHDDTLQSHPPVWALVVGRERRAEIKHGPQNKGCWALDLCYYVLSRIRCVREEKRNSMCIFFQRKAHVQRVKTKRSQQPNPKVVLKEGDVNLSSGAGARAGSGLGVHEGHMLNGKPLCTRAPRLPNSLQPPAPADPGNNAALC